MKSLDAKPSFVFIHVDEANRSESDPAAGVEGLYQFVLALARLQLVVNHPKHFGGNMFQFKLCLVGNPSLSFHMLYVLALQVRAQQAASLRQQLVGRAHHFGHNQRTIAKLNNVSIACDIDSSGVFGALDLTSSVDTEKLRVNRSAKNVK